MTKQLESTKKTFVTLQALHAALGAFPCDWVAFRSEMISIYKMDGTTLDSLARLGHLQETNRGVEFHA
jgi:hypothetical protein